MKYSISLEVDLPRSKVIELYVDPRNWAQWQQSLVRYETISGTERGQGSKIKIINRFGKRDVEILETVESSNLPEEFICTYEAQGAWNRVVNRFAEISPEKTLWEFDAEFRCRGMLKLLSMIMPGMFKEASQKEMHAFKRFAEENA